jgi:hypothetical protein
MRCTLIIVAIVAVTLLSPPADAQDGPTNIEWIVPGRGIGETLLGMTQAEVAAANARSICQVSARYTGGRAAVLSTSWGGACRTRQGIQVGMQLAVVVEFGPPGRQVQEEMYPESVALWIPYPARGIAFRVLSVPEHRTMLIQAIAVFVPRAAVWRP